MTNQGFSAMTIKSSPGGQTSDSLDAEESERARIVAAFMALFVEQSIKRLNLGANVSLAQLREEFCSTIAVLAARVEQIDGLVLVGESVEMAERAQGLAVLLSSVLRTWLDGADPNFAGIMSALDRAGAWAAPRRLPRPSQLYCGPRDALAPAAPAAAARELRRPPGLIGQVNRARRPRSSVTSSAPVRPEPSVAAHPGIKRGPP
jgi:hypothetical protein